MSYYRFERINYDENGNIITEARSSISLSNIFSRIFLQSVSDMFEDASHNLSNQIQNQINRPLNQMPVFSYKNMPNKEENNSCPICLDEYKEDSMIVMTDCIHFFHEKCLKEWSDNSHSTCPICRADLK